ncbi:hypothetical protein NHX12_011828 [Muraenolepis orangiensis]|uniref:Uncharacterized protein n=1 Tax=Muraenolepis orangiensis TaxID=630683 RepID=A0A9Q0I738_9TELE|nr:hypothetical protein NHX12_011828 [Muraenolepis orangiensis]
MPPTDQRFHHTVRYNGGQEAATAKPGIVPHPRGGDTARAGETGGENSVRSPHKPQILVGGGGWGRWGGGGETRCPFGGIKKHTLSCHLAGAKHGLYSSASSHPVSLQIRPGVIWRPSAVGSSARTYRSDSGRDIGAQSLNRHIHRYN